MLGAAVPGMGWCWGLHALCSLPQPHERSLALSPLLQGQPLGPQQKSLQRNQRAFLHVSLTSWEPESSPTPPAGSYAGIR